MLWFCGIYIGEPSPLSFSPVQSRGRNVTRSGSIPEEDEETHPGNRGWVRDGSRDTSRRIERSDGGLVVVVVCTRVHTWSEINNNGERRAAFTLHTRGREKQISSHTNERMHGEITSGGQVPEETKGMEAPSGRGERVEERKRVGVQWEKSGGKSGTEERGNRAIVGAAVAAAAAAVSPIRPLDKVNKNVPTRTSRVRARQ